MPPNLPPERPIISGCGSITENISLFLDHHSKHLVPEIDSYLQDTPDLLRQLEDLKDVPLPQGTFPVSIDVVGLYSNIPQAEAVEHMREALDSRSDKSAPTDFLIILLQFILTMNIFQFDRKFFIQLIGIAMGTRSAPTIANIFMAAIDKRIGKSGFINGESLIHFSNGLLLTSSYFGLAPKKNLKHFW